MWEDERNRLGGRWLINVNKGNRNAELDRLWLELVCIWCYSSHCHACLLVFYS